MKKISVKEIVLAAFFLALGLIMPFLTMQIPSIGSMLLPMHIPVILCGFICGGPLGLVVGFIVPLLRSALFSMPPMFPTAIAMAFELAAYVFISGFLYNHLTKKLSSIYLSLVVAMLGGRIIWGLVSLVLYGLSGQSFALAMFITGAFTTAIPGIILQLILIPAIVLALQKARLITNYGYSSAS